MKILGMEVFPRRRTDAEHIQSIRKMVGRARWIVVADWVIAGFCIATFWMIYHCVANLDGIFPGLSAELTPGLRIGISLGLLQGMLIWAAVSGIGAGIKILTGWRTERLMLQFHDELQRRDSQGASPTP